ncbi:hypothetical protein GQX74_005540, partial [Glossina fuscipes]
IQKKCIVTENKVRELEKDMVNVKRYAEALRRQIISKQKELGNVKRNRDALRKQKGSKQTEDYGTSNSYMNVMDDEWFEMEQAELHEGLNDDYYAEDPFLLQDLELELQSYDNYYAEDPFLLRDSELELQPYGMWGEY